MLFQLESQLSPMQVPNPLTYLLESYPNQIDLIELKHHVIRIDEYLSLFLWWSFLKVLQ